MKLVEKSIHLGRKVLDSKSLSERKELGQFITPAPIARFMAEQIGEINDGDTILDPAVGSGSIVSAVIEKAALQGNISKINIIGYEIDNEMADVAKKALDYSSEIARKSGLIVDYSIIADDFVLTVLNTIGRTDDTDKIELHKHFLFASKVVANPPYFKLPRSDVRFQLAAKHIPGNSNIYSLFMALSLRVLFDGGRATFLVPRGFCSGTSFAPFRKFLINSSIPKNIHLFESRTGTFVADPILQENVIFTLDRRHHGGSNQNSLNGSKIIVSKSNGSHDLSGKSHTLSITEDEFISDKGDQHIFRIPTSVRDKDVIYTIDRWPRTFADLGFGISVGKVVPFRCREFLTKATGRTGKQVYPLLWMQNIFPLNITWPNQTISKDQAIKHSEETSRLLIPSLNYVILRRFSSKDDRRRIVAAPLLKNHLKTKFIGLENHLLYVYREEGEFIAAEAVGLAALLNIPIIDKYFRLLSGTTQINKSELLSLSLPSLEVITSIGEAILAENSTLPEESICIAHGILQENGLISSQQGTMHICAVP